jgi:hypothetical protein
MGGLRSTHGMRNTIVVEKSEGKMPLERHIF